MVNGMLKRIATTMVAMVAAMTMVGTPAANADETYVGMNLISKNQPLWFGSNHDVSFGDQNKLIWQSDGNLVMYDIYERPVWQSGTADRGHYFAFQKDSNLVVYSENFTPIFATHTYSPRPLLVIQDHVACFQVRTPNVVRFSSC